MVRNQPGALVPILFGGDLELFRQQLSESAHPPRVVATGLLHEDSAVAHLALDYLTGELGPESLARNEQSAVAESPEVAPRIYDSTNDDSSKVEVVQLEQRINDLLVEVDSVQIERETLAARAEQAGAEVAQLLIELEKSAAQSAKLQSELDELRAATPSRTQQRKRDSKLRQAQRYLQEREELKSRLAAAERSKLEAIEEAVAIRAEAEDAEAELREKLRRHKRARSALERSLSTPEGRAQYLSRSISSEIGELERRVEGLPHGPTRTKASQRMQKLNELQELLYTTYLAVVKAPDRAGEPYVRVVSDRTVRVFPLGGGTEIGGSAVLVEGGDTRVLVDAGLRPQAEAIHDMAPPRVEEALRNRIDAVFVTHAHTDHSGFIPAIVRQHPGVKLITSPGTEALLPTMWDDSQKVSERRADALAEYMDAAPLYGEAEVEAAEDRIESVRFGQRKSLRDAQFELFPAGHIVGASGVVLHFGDQRVVITGDISYEAQATVDGATIPKSAHNADLLIIESTYCHDVRPPRQVQALSFVKGVEEVLNHHGRVLIPAFGLGRAQEVALLLKEQLGDTPVLIDGLAGRISRIFEAHASDEGRRLEIFGSNVRQIENRRQREREVKTFGTGVVITTSGMMTGGPVIRWAQEILPDRHSALFLCGYQDEESPGSALLSLVNGTGGRTLRLPGIEEDIAVQVNANVSMYHLSAHADREGLTDLIREVSPSETMLVHGYPAKQRGFARRLNQQQIRVVDTADWTTQ
jgi:Cft2 family RNA processing exonuclease